MSESSLRCGYCNLYISGRVYKSGDTVKRKCVARQIKVEFDHKICQYFNPIKYFHCNRHGERITFPECINRRMNYKNLSKYLYCKKCRQFDQELRDIVKLYFVDGAKIKKYNPEKPLRKLSRRNSSTKKRSLKRRTPKKRVLKKRSTKPEKKKRKIKRRS